MGGTLAPAGAEAWEAGRLADEVVPVSIPQRKGDPVVVAMDEGIRADTTEESLARLKPAFRPDGTITAGNASQISDGAAAVIVHRAEKAEQLGLRPMAEIVVARHERRALRLPPHGSGHRHAAALKKAGKDAHDLGLVEINEAFASVALNATRMLGVDEEIVNVNGGAVALGTRSGPAARGWCSRWPPRCAGGAWTSVAPRCAAAAARATR